MSITLERLRELALEVSTANGVCKTLRALGRNTETEESDYQAAVRAFDVGLRELTELRTGIVSELNGAKARIHRLEGCLDEWSRTIYAMQENGMEISRESIELADRTTQVFLESYDDSLNAIRSGKVNL